MRIGSLLKRNWGEGIYYVVVNEHPLIIAPTLDMSSFYDVESLISVYTEFQTDMFCDEWDLQHEKES